MRKYNYKKYIKMVLYVIMSIQIVLSILWVVFNYNTIPTFGDSPEYINLSKVLIVDEYRTILYPFLISVTAKVESLLGIKYVYILYLVQSILSFACIDYFVKSIYNLLGIKEKKLIDILFLDVYILSIPMITYMNFSILTDSIALSMMLIIVTQCVRIFYSKSMQIKDVIILFVSYCLESMIRADRIYTCGLFILVFSIILVIQKEFKRSCIVLAVLISAVLVNLGINYKTQEPGIYGRIKTDFSFILLDRVVWPNMSENYDLFAEEIKSSISFDEALCFDEHNNNVMYYMAPLLEERVGRDRAEKMYKDMAMTVFKNHPIKVICDIIEDFAGFVFTPTVAFVSNVGGIKTNYEWNITCCSSATPKLTKLYSMFFNFVIGILVIPIAILLCIKNRNRTIIKRFLKIIYPYFYMTILIGLWFAIGDGAPPNDRYMLIGYVTWTSFAIGMLKVYLEIRESERVL